MSVDHSGREYSCDEYARRRYANTRKVKRRREKALDYMDWMFNWNAQYNVIVLTLGYEEAHRPFVTLRRILDDRAHLLSLRYSNPVLSGIIGYMLSIEYGGHGGGFHMHCILFYSVEHAARLELSDVDVGNAIREIWCGKITRDQGYCVNTNEWLPTAPRIPYGNGVGLITRYDARKRASLRLYIVNYFAKNEQHVDNTWNPHSQLFVTGEVPTWTKSIGQDIDWSV